MAQRQDDEVKVIGLSRLGKAALGGAAATGAATYAYKKRDRLKELARKHERRVVPFVEGARGATPLQDALRKARRRRRRRLGLAKARVDDWAEVKRAAKYTVLPAAAALALSPAVGGAVHGLTGSKLAGSAAGIATAAGIGGLAYAAYDDKQSAPSGKAGRGGAAAG